MRAIATVRQRRRHRALLGVVLLGGSLGAFVPGMTAAVMGLVVALTATAVLVATLPWRRVLDSVDLLAGSPSTLTHLEERLGFVDGWLSFASPDHEVGAAERALAKDPDSWVGRLRLGLARENRGEELEADQLLRALIDSLRVYGHSAEHQYGMALAQAAREEYECAIVSLEPLLTFGGGPAAPWIARARLRRCVGDLGGALEDANEAVRRAWGEEDPWPHEVRGRLRALAGDLAGALTDVEASVRRSGPRGGPLLTRAVLRLLAGEVAGYDDLRSARAREPVWVLPRLWQVALGDETIDLVGLSAFEAELARCLRGTSPFEALIASARASPSQRTARRRQRRAYGLSAVAACRRGDREIAAEHVRAVLALGDDGGLEFDWAWVIAPSVGVS